MRRIVKGLGYARVMSTIAVFVALGGTSYAAVKVSGATVKDNSLTGKDVRDGSLLAADLRAGELRGGAQGPAGPPGPAGAPGAPGPSEAIARFGDRRGLSGTKQTVVSLTLPAGEWVITAGGLIDNTSVAAPRSGRCLIELGGQTIGDTGNLTAGRNDGGPSLESFSQTAVATSTTSQSLRLACTGTSTEVFVDRTQLVAVRIGDLSGPGGN